MELARSTLGPALLPTVCILACSRAPDPGSTPAPMLSRRSAGTTDQYQSCDWRSIEETLARLWPVALRLSGNEGGRLAWFATDLALASVAALERREIPTLRKHLAAWIGELPQLTDSARRLPDFRGRAAAVWSATRYSSDSSARVPWLVHTARIGKAVARARALPAWDREQLRSLETSLALVATSLRSFDGSYRESGSSAWYVMLDAPIPRGDSRLPAPLNMNAAAAEAYLLLAPYVQDSAAWERRGRRLMDWVTTAVLETADDDGRWAYWPGLVPPSSSRDDVSHAGMVVEAVHTGVGGGVVGQAERLRGVFTRAFTAHMADSQRFRDEHSLERTLASSIYRWLAWRPPIPPVVQAAEQLISGQWLRRSPDGVLACLRAPGVLADR